MKPIRINNYCFDRIHLWIQYHPLVPQFVEVVVEVFYPESRNANGLVMFNHGFLIGNDLLYYPKKIIGALLDDNPLFGINPSAYYNYSKSIVERNWAMAFVSASHAQVQGMPWTDIGGNPRVGQEAYAAASYLIKFGATDFFYKVEPAGPNCSNYDPDLACRSRFLVSNNVIFAGHSVGGAHAQAAACGFEKLHQIGCSQFLPFDPVMYDREVLPNISRPMSAWAEQERAKPIGLIQLSPVDEKVPILIPGMSAYREALAATPMPELMIVGNCDTACLDPENSTPPAWSATPGQVTQFAQEAPAGSDSWAVVACVDKGSHCGYLTEKSELCSMADKNSPCKDAYKAMGEESAMTVELLKRFIAMYPGTDGFGTDRQQWLTGDFIQWLNTENPYGTLKLQQMPTGGYIQTAPSAGKVLPKQ